GMLPTDVAMLVDSVRRLAPELIESHHKGGYVWLSIRGLEFARVSVRHKRVQFGLGEPKQKLDAGNEIELRRIVEEIVGYRRVDADSRNDLIFRAQSERWLESMIRNNVTAIDPTLDPRYVYSQVPTYRGEQRTFIDLLAATRDGQLVVMELKVS